MKVIFICNMINGIIGLDVITYFMSADEPAANAIILHIFINAYRDEWYVSLPDFRYAALYLDLRIRMLVWPIAWTYLYLHDL